MSARGERTIKVGTRDVTILFTNRALASAEKRLERGVFGVLDGLRTGTSGLNEVAVLLQVGMEAARVDARAGGNQVSLDAAFSVIDQVGFTNILTPIAEAAIAVLTYSNGNNDGAGVIEGERTDGDAAPNA